MLVCSTICMQSPGDAWNSCVALHRCHAAEPLIWCSPSNPTSDVSPLVGAAGPLRCGSRPSSFSHEPVAVQLAFSPVRACIGWFGRGAPSSSPDRIARVADALGRALHAGHQGGTAAPWAMEGCSCHRPPRISSKDGTEGLSVGIAGATPRHVLPAMWGHRLFAGETNSGSALLCCVNGTGCDLCANRERKEAVLWCQPNWRIYVISI
jgi:hypothetical protein